LRFAADDLTQIPISRTELLRESRLSGLFKEVQTELRTVEGHWIIRLEQVAPTIYPHLAADRIQAVCDLIRPYIWTTVTTVAPYRRYYLYASPIAQHVEVLPQLLSVYAIAYYLGSITRYRPHHFSSILEGPHGDQVQEILSSQPSQFLYLLASEFAERDVTRTPLV
jgi:hypothetical protein